MELRDQIRRALDQVDPGPPPTFEVITDVDRSRRVRRTAAGTGLLAVAAALVIGVLALVPGARPPGWPVASDGPVVKDPASSDGHIGLPSDEVPGPGAPDLQGACPASFTEGRRTDTPAEFLAPAVFSAAGEIAVCRYEAGAIGDGGAWMAWSRIGDPVPVTDTEIASVLVDFIAEAGEPDPELACTADLGPRMLVAHLAEDGRISLAVVDDFGCRSIRVLRDLGGAALTYTDPTWWSADAKPRQELRALLGIDEEGSR